MIIIVWQRGLEFLRVWQVCTLVSHSMEENRSWGASSSSANYILWSLLNPKIRDIFHRVPKLAYVLSRMNPFVYNPISLWSVILSTPTYSSLFCSLNPSDKNPICIYIFTCACYMPCPFYLSLSLFDHVNKCLGVQIIKLQFVYFFSVILIFLPSLV